MKYIRTKDEQWKTIEIAPNYSVSSLGKIKNNKTQRILKPKLIRGYEYVCLRNNNINLCKQVHRLVAIAFIPNILNKECVNHKDFNRSNNYVNNLEWCTKSENQIWSSERISKGHCKNLYANICENKGGFVYQKRNGKAGRFRKWFRTLAEAVSFKEQYESLGLTKVLSM